MKKRTRNRIIIAIVMVLLIVCSSLGSFYIAERIFEGKSIIYQSNNISFENNADPDKIAKFKEVKKKISDDFLHEYKEEDLIEGAIKGMVDALKDPYTRYYTKEEMEERNNQLQGYYYGIGVVISAQSKDYLLIGEVKEATPAADADLREGDKIISIDDKDVSEYTYEQILNIFKTNGRSINLGILRGENKFTVNITVNIIEIISVTSKIIQDDIGYIRIRQFDSKTANAFENELKVLIGKGISRLIIDLRDNGGGLASEMTRIADAILPEGKLIYYEVDKKGNKIQTKYSDVNSVNMPIVVLINGKTASASELLASTLRDNKDVPLIGGKSFGKAVAQEAIIFEKDGSGLVISISQYFTPSGVNIHGNGLKPDIEVALNDQYKNTSIDNIPDGKDDQLNEAIATIVDMN